MILYPPIYLVTTTAQCWRCHTDQPVAAIGGTIPEDDLYDEGPRLVSFVTDMPDDLLDLIVERHPRYMLHRSRRANATYFTNMCRCGGNYGDFYLHSKPGAGTFWPTCGEDADLLAVHELPVDGPVELDARIGGSLTFLLDYNARLDSSEAR